jgi:IS5 family transposase
MLAMCSEMDQNYTSVVLDRERPMSLGVTERQGDLLDDVNRFCDRSLPENSIYAVLHRERHRLFPDEMFADLFSDRGRRSVPPSVVAVVMVLQRLEGLSDREAVDRYSFDVRWRYAAGVGGYDGGGWASFAHTVLVDMRARLAASVDERRIFNVTVEAAAAAGLVGAKRVLDSTPLYDAVATMDTVTLIRSAIRGLLKVADAKLEAELRSVLSSGDDYASSAKPQIDWDDHGAREALIDSRAKDAFACLGLLDGRQLGPEVSQAAELLTKVVGQDLESTEDGTFRIARRVAPDRIISTVDPEARHGHKTASRGFDGYKGHAAVDPDSEIITDTAVTPGNAGDASVAAELIDDLLAETPDEASDDTSDGPVAAEATDIDETDTDDAEESDREADQGPGPEDNGADAVPAEAEPPTGDAEASPAGEPDRPAVYGDAAYGTGEFLTALEEAGIEANCKTQPPHAPDGRFSKDRFIVDLDEGTVVCPAGVTADIDWARSGGGIANFGDECAACPLVELCTTSKTGRTVTVSPHEEVLARTRRRQASPDWVADYRATRPKVERKLGHLMRRRHGGRRARVRGTAKVDADFNLLAAATNLARLAVLSLQWTPAGWAAVTP